jgi:PAS domain-containing protein
LGLFTPTRRPDKQGLSYRLGVEFEAARVRQLYSLMPQAVLGGLLIVASLTVYYSGYAQWWQLALWAVAMLLIFGLRYASKRWFDNVASDVEAIGWERPAIWLAVASGLGFASFTLVLADVEPFDRHYFYYMLLGASLIASSVTQAPSGPAFYGYIAAIVPFTVPVLLWLRSGWSLEITLLVVGFLAYLVLGFRRVHQSLMESLEVRMEARQLAEQESRLLDAAQSGIVFLMRDLIVRCNRAFAQMAGEELGALKRARLDQVVREPAEYEALTEILRRAQRDGPVRTLNVRLRSGTAAPLWCAVTTSPIRARHADAGSVLIFTNIEEEKRAQQAYELALAAGRIGMWDWDLESGRLRLSPELLHLIGETQAKVETASLQSILHEEDRERVAAAQQACIQTGGEFDQVFRLRGAGGVPVRMRGRGVVVRNAGGEPIRFVGVAMPAHDEPA